MTDAAIDVVPTKKPGGLKGPLIGLAAALLLGGAGFWGIYSGMLDPAKLFAGGGEQAEASPGVAFVPMDPIAISLPPEASARHLRFIGQLEVAPDQKDAVTLLMPRVLDVLNTYLRAVEVHDLQEPAALPRLRAQMLRRVQVVVGEGAVRDLLITEFVMN